MILLYITATVFVFIALTVISAMLTARHYDEHDWRKKLNP
jgi:hypothetical protein